MQSLPGLLVLIAFCAFYQSVKILPHRLFYLYFSVELKYFSILLLLVAACSGAWCGRGFVCLVCCAGQGWSRQGCRVACKGQGALELWAQWETPHSISPPLWAGLQTAGVQGCVCCSPRFHLGLASTMAAFCQLCSFDLVTCAK